jgi:N-acetylmuramoyl-L-alanine amidase
MYKILIPKKVTISKFRKFVFHFILIFLTNIVWAQEINHEEDNKIHTVVIDPGHGGKDSGAQGKISKEKDIVLAIGLKLGKYIEDNLPEVKVIYTRKTDEFIPLYRRAEIANENKADLFISIHANSNPSSEPTGTSSHVLGLHRANENFEVAKRENSVIFYEDDYTSRYENFDPNSPESYIAFSLMQFVYLDQSINFADMIQSQFRERVKRKDRGVVQQGLLVLAQTSMPGVLIETGFISNPTEEQFLNSDEGQDYIASAIFRAFRDYKIDIESKNGTIIAHGGPLDKDSVSQINKKQGDTSDSLKKSSIYFKVQIASSSNKVEPDSDIYNEYNDVEEFDINNTFKYAVGIKFKYDDIVEYSKWVKSKYPDAFIIAVKEGRIIPVQQALQELYNK